MRIIIFKSYALVDVVVSIYRGHVYIAALMFISLWHYDEPALRTSVPCRFHAHATYCAPI